MKQIPNSVNHRRISISSDKAIFDEAEGEYQRSLASSGYDQDLVYPENYEVDDQSHNNKNRKRNKKRNILWYNPPYNSSFKTDFGRQFLKLIKSTFLKATNYTPY